MPLNAKLALVNTLGQWTSTAEWQAVRAKTEVSAVRNEVKTPGYSLFNLRTRYETKRFSVDVGIDNVFNRFYTLPLGGAYTGQGMTMSRAGIPWGVGVAGPARSLYTASTSSSDPPDSPAGWRPEQQHPGHADGAGVLRRESEFPQDFACLPPQDYASVREALLHKSAAGRTTPIPRRIYPMRTVCGVPSAVKRFRIAAQI
jgi:hypothetical protein